MKKVGFVSLGCPKNLVDSEVMMGMLDQKGWTITPQASEAEVVVVNTCAFIESAKRESIEAILDMAELKSRGKARKLIVTGCLAERYREELRREIPEVDVVFGVNELEKIVSSCENHDAADPEGDRSYPLYLYDETTPRLKATPRFTTYMKLAEGCDHTCSFCIIPKLRGPFRSRPVESLLAEARTHAAQGVCELNLISQDTTHYGHDLGDANGLPRLLAGLAQIDGLDWIRFLYCYPNHVTRELMETVARHKNICRYFDIPLQHVSEKLLQSMRRGGSRKRFVELLSSIREVIPEAALRTTFIVGYPGETGEDFRELCDFVEEIQFDHVGVFAYSDEEGTRAFEGAEKVPTPQAEERRAQLMEIQRRLASSRNAKRVGQEVRVLIEGPSSETDLLLQGRMESQAPGIDGVVLINDVGDGLNPQPGDFAQVEISEAHDYDVVGKITAIESRT
ncbi:MAG: 30S ribosomal protein S12 methylthiotransferase RimO [Acidobacteriia bacterium]|nr:30S ribosomal protein S12 methylthiotransferase RimO [Terriglobia bacterium]